MDLLQIILVVSSITVASTSLVERFEENTAPLVDTLLTAYQFLQTSVKDEFSDAHNFASAGLIAVVNKLNESDASAGNNTNNTHAIREKIKGPFMEILDADHECTDEGLVDVANRVVRVVEIYHKVHSILELMEICGEPAGAILEESCVRNINKAAIGAIHIEDMIVRTMAEIDKVGESVPNCIMIKYNEILNKIDDLLV